MGSTRTLPISPSHSLFFPSRNHLPANYYKHHGLIISKSPSTYCSNKLVVSANLKDSTNNNGDKEDQGEEKSKKSWFTSVTDALDFAQVRSSKDAELLEEARDATESGGRMNKQQYGALRRKIGGTYQDFFKSYVDVDGQYVEEGWVDKTCKICKKDTRGEPRQVDRLGRYAHMTCLDKPKSNNFFSGLFSR